MPLPHEAPRDPVADTTHATSIRKPGGRMTKRFPRTLLAIVVAMTLAACGGNVPPTGGPASVDQTPPPSSTTAPTPSATLASSAPSAVGASVAPSPDASPASSPSESLVDGTFTLTGSMGVVRERPTATLLRDGRVLVAGGYPTQAGRTSEVFDPVTGRFTPSGNLLHPRWSASAVLLADGRVLIVGGLEYEATSPDGPAHAVGEAEVWDPATNLFTQPERFARPARRHT